jgi:long-chain acyl-CoA synthetase
VNSTHPFPGHWGTEVVRLDAHPQCLVYANRWRTVRGFLDDARRWGEREYLIENERRLTFNQFLDCVETLSWKLRDEHGVRAGDRVLLLGANSVDWIVAFFAVLASGATIVSGNAWWSRKELDHALSVASPVLVITDNRRAPLVPAVWPVIRLPLDLPSRQCDRLEALDGDLFDEELPAVILFTSGTTGAPKAASLSHRSVIANQQNFLVGTRRFPSELPADHEGAITLVTVPLFHMGGIQSILAALLTGGKLVLHVGRFDAATILPLIETEKIQSWGAVPTMVSRVIDHPDLALFDTSTLRSVTVSGTHVSPQMLEQVRHAFPSVQRKARTIYGMTEAGGTLTVATGKDLISRPGTVGRPFPVVELKIKDPDASGKGEIIARSPTNMTEYLGGSESCIDPAGWLHTGDIGRIDDEGYLFIEGRIKDVIIRGGENIASPNVEAAIREHPAVAEVAVVGLPDNEFGEVVAAVVVPRDGVQVTPHDLKAFASERLAYFEVPSRWWLRREPLPATATGKVVKQALREAWPIDDSRM